MPTKIIVSKLKKPSGTVALKSARKGRKGFTKGLSGNPKGRPKGSRNQAGLLVQNLIDGKSEEIARAVIKRAIKGDFQAEKFCLERLLPPQRSRPVTVELPNIETAEDIQKAIDKIWTALSDGELTLDEATSLKDFVNAKREAIETAELASELEQIKKHLGLNT